MISKPTMIGQRKPEPEPEPEHTADPVTARRVDALRHARVALVGLDLSPDDLIIVADWIDTGRADVALAMTAERYRHYQPTALTAEP